MNTHEVILFLAVLLFVRIVSPRVTKWLTYLP